jgi:branched-chain amino acid transport system permease protein
VKQLVEYLVIYALLAAPIYAIAASGLVVTYTTTGIFNFAHGAIGMIVAFSYWQITDEKAWGLPVWFGLPFSLFVLAPAIGWTLDRVLFRRLAGASTITTIVATIGLLFGLVSLANIIWPSGTGTRDVAELFPGETVTILDVNISYHEIIALAAAVAVAVGLRALLYGTRLGTAMRAVVDSRDLTALNGVEPDRISSVAWMLGCSLAGLAGILAAPDLTLTSIALTLVVIQAYAVAMVGRLRSLPMTFLGALILAELQKLIAYIDVKDWAGSLDSSLKDAAAAAPALMLFVVLIVMGEDRAALRPENIRFRVPRPSLLSVTVTMAGLVGVVALIGWSGVISADTVDVLGRGLAFGVIMLSLVLLTGWAGQVSLAQLSLGGIAALAVWKLGPITGLVAGVLITAVVGALVALPALRMRSLYLALMTMAFALLLEQVVYGNNAIFSSFIPFATGSATADRPSMLESDRAFFVFIAVCFGLVAIGLTAIRNGHFGRRLAAMKDSPAACATLGLDLTITKLQVFALSAGIAGLGGALLAMWKSASVGRTDFALLDGGAEAGLPMLLVAVIGGITSVTGALVGCILFVGMPLIGRWYPSLTNTMNLMPSIAGIGLSKNPDGAAHQVAEAIEEQRAAREAARTDPLTHPERLGLDDGHIPADQAARLDEELGLSWGQ